MQAASAKHTTMEAYDKASFTLSGKSFDGGCLAVWMSSAMLGSRDRADQDSTMRFLSGLISRDYSKHPAWEKALTAKVSPERAFTYEAPASNTNYSA